MQPTREFKLLTAFQFVDMQRKRQVRGNTAQSFDNVSRARRAIDVERLSPLRVRHHEEHAGQTRDMVRVHVGEADSSKLAEAPAQQLPWDLGAFATIEER